MSGRRRASDPSASHIAAKTTLGARGGPPLYDGQWWQDAQAGATGQAWRQSGWTSPSSGLRARVGSSATVGSRVLSTTARGSAHVGLQAASARETGFSTASPGVAVVGALVDDAWHAAPAGTHTPMHTTANATREPRMQHRSLKAGRRQSPVWHPSSATAGATRQHTDDRRALLSLLAGGTTPRRPMSAGFYRPSSAMSERKALAAAPAKPSSAARGQGPDRGAWVLASRRHGGRAGRLAMAQDTSGSRARTASPPMSADTHEGGLDVDGAAGAPGAQGGSYAAVLGEYLHTSVDRGVNGRGEDAALSAWDESHSGTDGGMGDDAGSSRRGSARAAALHNDDGSAGVYEDAGADGNDSSGSDNHSLEQSLETPPMRHRQRIRAGVALQAKRRQHGRAPTAARVPADGELRGAVVHKPPFLPSGARDHASRRRSAGLSSAQAGVDPMTAGAGLSAAVQVTSHVTRVGYAPGESDEMPHTEQLLTMSIVAPEDVSIHASVGSIATSGGYGGHTTGDVAQPWRGEGSTTKETGSRQGSTASSSASARGAATSAVPRVPRPRPASAAHVRARNATGDVPKRSSSAQAATRAVTTVHLLPTSGDTPGRDAPAHGSSGARTPYERARTRPRIRPASAPLVMNRHPHMAIGPDTGDDMDSERGNGDGDVRVRVQSAAAGDSAARGRSRHAGERKPRVSVVLRTTKAAAIRAAERTMPEPMPPFVSRATGRPYADAAVAVAQPHSASSSDRRLRPASASAASHSSGSDASGRQARSLGSSEGGGAQGRHVGDGDWVRARDGDVGRACIGDSETILLELKAAKAILSREHALRAATALAHKHATLAARSAGATATEDLLTAPNATATASTDGAYLAAMRTVLSDLRASTAEVARLLTAWRARQHDIDGASGRPGPHPIRVFSWRPRGESPGDDDGRGGAGSDRTGAANYLLKAATDTVELRAYSLVQAVCGAGPRSSSNSSSDVAHPDDNFDRSVGGAGSVDCQCGYGCDCESSNPLLLPWALAEAVRPAAKQLQKAIVESRGRVSADSWVRRHAARDGDGGSVAGVMALVAGWGDRDGEDGGRGEADSTGAVMGLSPQAAVVAWGALRAEAGVCRLMELERSWRAVREAQSRDDAYDPFLNVMARVLPYGGVSSVPVPMVPHAPGAAASGLAASTAGAEHVIGGGEDIVNGSSAEGKRLWPGSGPAVSRSRIASDAARQRTLRGGVAIQSVASADTSGSWRQIAIPASPVRVSGASGPTLRTAHGMQGLVLVSRRRTAYDRHAEETAVARLHRRHAGRLVLWALRCRYTRVVLATQSLQDAQLRGALGLQRVCRGWLGRCKATVRRFEARRRDVRARRRMMLQRRWLKRRAAAQRIQSVVRGRAGRRVAGELATAALLERARQIDAMAAEAKTRGRRRRVELHRFSASRVIGRWWRAVSAARVLHRGRQYEAWTRAAVGVQRVWRGVRGRDVAARRRAQARRDAAIARAHALAGGIVQRGPLLVARLRLRRGALGVQRLWRGHRDRARVQRALDYLRRLADAGAHRRRGAGSRVKATSRARARARARKQAGVRGASSGQRGGGGSRSPHRGHGATPATGVSARV